MITRKHLQDLSPDSSNNRVRLIGTATSPRPLLSKPKIKKETVVKTEMDLEISDYLAKGLCVSAHTDGSACANIQNPNNINVRPMGIREHRKKQRAERALFEAHMKARKEAQSNQKKSVSQSGNNNINISVTIVSSTEINKDSVDVQTISDNILTEVMSTFKLPKEHSLELFSDADEYNDEETSNRNAVTENIDIGKVATQKPSSLTEKNKQVLSQLDSDDHSRNGVTQDLGTLGSANATTESNDATIEQDGKINDTCMDIDLDNTIDYTDQNRNYLDSDAEELILNKVNQQTYSHAKTLTTSRQTSEIPVSTTIPPGINTSIDIEMDDDIDTAVELCSLSDNLADNLVITDLEELMNENEIPPQTILPIRPHSPRGTFTYRFQGLRHKASTPVSAGENKYKCPTCPTTWNTRGKMCEHYRKTHPPPLPCTDCNMTFTSPLSLARHRYKHKE